MHARMNACRRSVLHACMQVKRCWELAAKALKDGMCVVIGLQSTGEHEPPPSSPAVPCHGGALLSALACCRERACHALPRTAVRAQHEECCATCCKSAWTVASTGQRRV